MVTANRRRRAFQDKTRTADHRGLSLTNLVQPDSVAEDNETETRRDGKKLWPKMPFHFYIRKCAKNIKMFRREQLLALKGDTS